MTLSRAIDWAFRDRRTGRIVVAQWPNLWLWIFVAASAAEIAAGDASRTGAAAGLIGRVFLVIWAGDEVLRGVNPWRRALGAAVLIGSLVRFLA